VSSIVENWTRGAYHEPLEVELVSGGVLVHDADSVDKSGHIYSSIGLSPA